MDAGLIRTGKVYLLAGEGEKMATGRPGEYLSHGNRVYWALPEQVVRKATGRDIKARDRQARPRGVGCDDPECWCQVFLRKGRGGVARTTSS